MIIKYPLHEVSSLRASNSNIHLTTSKYARLTQSSTDTALRDITDLMEKGALLKSGSGGRSTHYLLNLQD
ncbi:MAG: hypothetical protein ITF99_05455 [Chryseobacterium sp.]|nr:hypothetical protein [Chryseobacterium sp.]